MPWMSLGIGSLMVAGRRAALLAATIVGTWAGAADPPAAGDRRAEAFAAFERLPAAVDLPTGSVAGPLGVVPLGTRSRVVDLGPVPLKDLVGPSFRLAVPEETIDGRPFQADIVPLDQAEAGPRWEIRQLIVRAVPGEPAGPRTLATLAERDGRAILEVERAHLASRGLAILRRCVILAEALNPTTRQLATREIRLVTPAKVGPLVVGAREGPKQMTIPVPAGIASRDAIGREGDVGLALPVSGMELEAVWDGQPVSMRWTRAAGPPHGPGVGRWTVPLGRFEDGAELSLTVTLSLPRATLESVPSLMGPPGRAFDQAALAKLLDEESDLLAGVEKKFRARIAACPLRDYDRSSGQDGPSGLVRSWLDAPLATEQVMVVGLPGHETARSSMDLYLREEYARLREELAEEWRKKLAAMPDGNDRSKTVYFGASLPQAPEDFATWQKQWRGARESEWESMFVVRLDAWSEWFWRHFKARWGRNQATVQKALERTVELRVVGITSIARDALGTEYRVPLIVSLPAAAPPGGILPAQPPPPETRKRGIPPEVVTP